MTLNLTQRIGISLALAVVIFATRIGHFAALPDVTWAAFFLGGFYLRGSTRFAFALLIGVAILADWVVISGQGFNFWTHYCVSPAYWCLLPAYFSLWAGGLWLAKRCRGLGLRELGLLVPTLVVATSLCFLLSNGSFYWLSPVVAEPTLTGWLTNMGHWYLAYLGTTALHVTLGVGLHLLAVALLGALAHWQDPSRHA